jgi:hypothetical protein
MLAYPHASICTLNTGSFVVIETDGDKRMHTLPHACICAFDTGSFVVIETDADRRMHTFPHAWICASDTGSFVVIETDGDKRMHTFPHAYICVPFHFIFRSHPSVRCSMMYNSMEQCISFAKLIVTLLRIIIHDELWRAYEPVLCSFSVYPSFISNSNPSGNNF